MNENQAKPSLPASQAPRSIVPEVLPPDGEPNNVKAEGWQKIFWIILSIVCVVYIIVPNIPIPFFLDEGLVGMILLYALERLGIRIPVLHWFLQRRMGKKSLKSGK